MKWYTKLYLLRFSNHTGYCTDMRDYLTDEVKKGTLNHKQIKYLYKNLYRRKTPYIRQNIFPVSQAMINGVSTYDIEKIASKLLDANQFTIFSVGGKNDKYNKLFKDLEFMLNKFAHWSKNCMQTTTHRNVFLYTRILNDARLNKDFFDDEIYKYVEKEARNYHKNRKKDFKPELRIRHIRHTVSNLVNYDKTVDKDLETKNKDLNL